MPRPRLSLPSSSQNPIGVFDSGIGGLSVLRALQTELAHEHFVYFADSAHAPYGDRDAAHAVARSVAISEHLIAQHRIKALVVACNTATAAAIGTLRLRYPQLPIIGIEPALKPAALHSHSKTIGVLATRNTLHSEKFQRLLQSLQGQAHFILQACDGLAAAIERHDAKKIAYLCQHYTQALGKFGPQPGEIDVLVLGCTHYPFVQETLLACIDPATRLLECGTPVAQQTARVLRRHQQLAQGNVQTTQVGLTTAPHTEDLAVAIPDTAPVQTRIADFYTSGQASALNAAVCRFLGLEGNAKRVEI